MTVDTDRPADLENSHITAVDGNVFADLGFSSEEAKALLADADARIAKAENLIEGAATGILPRRHGTQRRRC